MMATLRRFSKHIQKTVRVYKYRINIYLISVFLDWTGSPKIFKPIDDGSRNVIFMGDRRGPIDAVKRIKIRWHDNKAFKLKRKLEEERREANKRLTEKTRGPKK